jgi:hypothetical protein
MNIPQPEGGGNGESADVVNDWLPWSSPATVAPNHQSGAIFGFSLEFF